MRDHFLVTEGESAFVEEMGQALATYGMTPMAGRMWGWLLICEPPEQTAADLAEALQASRGSPTHDKSEPWRARAVARSAERLGC